jgi:hypothetical protein
MEEKEEGQGRRTNSGRRGGGEGKMEEHWKKRRRYRGDGRTMKEEEKGQGRWKSIGRRGGEVGKVEENGR